MGMFSSHLLDEPCKVFVAPLNFRFPGKSTADEEIVTVLQPYLYIKCDLTKLDERGCNGAPDLVIEILSPSNNKRDLKYKYPICEEPGVRECRVVYPSEQTVTIHTLMDGRYVASRPLITEELSLLQWCRALNFNWKTYSKNKSADFRPRFKK